MREAYDVGLIRYLSCWSVNGIVIMCNKGLCLNLTHSVRALSSCVSVSGCVSSTSAVPLSLCVPAGVCLFSAVFSPSALKTSSSYRKN